MIVNEEIFEAYLKEGHIDKFKDHWLFAHLEKMSGGNAVFVQPNYGAGEVLAMKGLADELGRAIENFQPNNLALWDLLFDKWQETISTVAIYLVVGLPAGFDALALKGPDGQAILVYDLGNWLRYKDRIIEDVANNLLTHELAHVCIEKAWPSLAEVYISGTYREGLDAITFNEGWAHLLAFENKNIAAVDWQSDEFNEIYVQTSAKMAIALGEEDSIQQKKFLQDATMGSYYDKFAAMVGMFYLARQWLAAGNSGLQKVFKGGFVDFARRAMKR